MVFAFDREDQTHSVCLPHCVAASVLLLVCPSRLAVDWQSVDLCVRDWGSPFPSPPLLQQLTDKVRDSSCLSFSAPDSISLGRQTPDNPAVPGTHHHQLILHHHFLICSLRAYFSGCDQATSPPCFLTSLSLPPSITGKGSLGCLKNRLH